MKLCSLIMLVALSMSMNTRTGIFSQQTEEERLLHNKSKVELKRVESYLKETVMCGGEQNPEMDALVAQYLTPERYKQWWNHIYHNDDAYWQEWNESQKQCAIYMFNLVKDKQNAKKYFDQVYDLCMKGNGLKCYYALYTKQKLEIAALVCVITHLVPPLTLEQAVKQHINATPEALIREVMYKHPSIYSQSIRETIACGALEQAAHTDMVFESGHKAESLLEVARKLSDFNVILKIFEKNPRLAAGWVAVHTYPVTHLTTLAQDHVAGNNVQEHKDQQPSTSLAVLASTRSDSPSPSSLHQRSRRLACDDAETDDVAHGWNL